MYEPDVRRAKRPFYNLMMFPYPSAEGLHIGAVRTFTGVDIYGRMKRMQGYQVFEPIGLDGFGIHSENYALKIGKHPREHAKDSEKNFYRQLAVIGNGFAWDERVETYDPEYYQWTQWIFVRMFKRGLAYRKKAPVNWCPSCKTVLADEQVISGECERCESKVVKKELEQWFFKITDYAERLLKNLEKLDWSERVKIAQRNWIGKSEGALIKFKIQKAVAGHSERSEESHGKERDPSAASQPQDDGMINYIEVFTTRPDTLFGATYLVVAPEHDFISSKFKNQNAKLQSEIQNWEEIQKYIDEAKSKSDEERMAGGKEKTGVELKGAKAINPANNEEIPIWVADYVLGHVGTGAIMAVPAHDERDFEFAKKFNLPIRQVIEAFFTQTIEPGKVVDGLPFDHRDSIIAIVKHWREEKYLALQWKKVAWGTFITGGIEQGQTSEEAAKMEIREETGYLHPKLLADFGVLHGKFYHVPKKTNRFAHAHTLFFQLQDDDQGPIAAAESETHEVMWLTKEELRRFLTPDTHQRALELLNGKAVYTGPGLLTDSGKFTGMDSEKARWEITKFVGGKRITQYRLRDWLISRQRYWGPPIPMIYCNECARLRQGFGGQGWQPVPEKDLPVRLPYIKNFRPTGTERSPLATVEKFYKVRCPKCKSWARRETDVSDAFLDSSWYYLGYLLLSQEQRNRGQKFSIAKTLVKKWLPVDMYIGGAEHSVLHLLYSRFVAMAFHDWGLFTFEEPFIKFRAHGLVTKDGAKMSKSKGNVVNPDEYIRAYGIDAIRMYLAFMAPFEQGGDFRDTGIRGITRFLERVWRFANAKCKMQNAKLQRKIQNDSIKRVVHKVIKKVSEDIEELRYNTAISALMALLNEFEKNLDAVAKEDVATFLKLLAPFAPYITEELWQQLEISKYRNRDMSRSIHHAPWPRYDPDLIREDTFELVIQVNGKVRGRITVPGGISEGEARKAALSLEGIKRYIPREARKVVFVPDKLINFVV